MSAAPRPSHAGPRGLKLWGSSLPLKPIQTKNPPSKIKINSVIMRNRFAGLGMAAFGPSDPLDLYRFQLDRLLRLVIRAAGKFRNFDGYVHALDHFAENGVAVIEPRRRRHGDKKLAPVRAGSGVGHGKLAGL